MPTSNHKQNNLQQQLTFGKYAEVSSEACAKPGVSTLFRHRAT